MEDFVSFKGAKITDKLVEDLRTNFKWTIFTIGKAKTHVTKYGGVHYSGQLTYFPVVSFEIKRGGSYLMITLMEYPKGVILHIHIYYPDIKKRSDWKSLVESVYMEVGEYIKESIN